MQTSSTHQYHKSQNMKITLCAIRSCHFTIRIASPLHDPSISTSITISICLPPLISYLLPERSLTARIAATATTMAGAEDLMTFMAFALNPSDPPFLPSDDDDDDDDTVFLCKGVTAVEAEAEADAAKR
mmetsp:Transcript_14984/g.21745  ORF Transcript_14984/g.21745 Transcript_14984/m.21745 type:complete len:129 (+) Transcript_14984:294-680(+)